METKFIVGYTANKFSMLGYAGSHIGDRMIGSDLRSYDGIERVVPYDPHCAEHSEFSSFHDYAVQRDERRANAKKGSSL